MDIEHIQRAAKEIVDLLEDRKVQSQEDPEERTPGHAMWLAETISSTRNPDRVTMRWYGFLQAMIVLHHFSDAATEEARVRKFGLDDGDV